MITRSLIVATLVALAGCVVPPAPPDFAKHRQEKVDKLNQELSSWHGHDINELIGKWGPPTSTFRLPNGSMMYSYTRAIAGISCTQSFTVDQQTGRIIGHTWNRLCV